jgi:hypothetical protein
MNVATAHQRFYSPFLDERLNKKFISLKSKTILSAHSYADKNLPNAEQDHLLPYLSESQIECQNLLNEVNQQLQSHTVGTNAKELIRTARTERQTLTNKLRTRRERLIEVTTELGHFSTPYSKIKVISIWVIIGIISLFEGMWAIPVFENLGTSYIGAIMMGLLFAVVLGAFSKLFLPIVMLGKTKPQRRIIFCILTLMTLAMFLFFAEQRAQWLSEPPTGSQGQGLQISSTPFAIVSLLLFLVSVSMAIFQLPSKEDRITMSEFKIKEAELHKAQHDVKQAEQSLKQAESTINLKLADSASLMEAGASYEYQILNFSKLLITIFTQENILSRTDDSRPKCFDDEVAFNFNTNFIQYFNN